MLFKILQETLIVHLRDRVRSGELTERGLARLTGVSQPHIHNVLKGVRSLSVEYADQILEKLGIAPSDLIGAGDLGWEPMHEPVFTHVPWLGGKAGPSKELSDRYQDKVFFLYHRHGPGRWCRRLWLRWRKIRSCIRIFRKATLHWWIARFPPAMNCGFPRCT